MAGSKLLEPLLLRLAALEEERRACAERLHALDDKVWRAMGALQNARLISSNEAMQYLSHVRMGLHVGRVTKIDLQTIVVNPWVQKGMIDTLAALHGRTWRDARFPKRTT